MAEGKRGAPKGNQNARKHGFYSPVLTEEEKEDLKKAVEIEGLNEEIALLRVKIKSIIEHDPDNLTLLLDALSTLHRLLRSREIAGMEDKQGLKQAIANIIKEIAIPLGIELGEKFI